MKANIIYILTLLVLFVFYSCNKDDGPKTPLPDPIDQPDPNPGNSPPAGFGLLSPANDASDESRTLIFTWDQATDPDGDPVTYDLFMDTMENPETLIAEDLGMTSFEFSASLDFDSTYYWKVVAKDNKEASVTSSVQSFTIEKKSIKFLKTFMHIKESGTDMRQQEFVYRTRLASIQDKNEAVWDTQYFQSNFEFVALGGLTTQVMGSPQSYKYDYTQDIKQKSVEIINSSAIHRWQLEYDGQDRLKSVLLTDSSDEARRLILIETTFSYINATATYPNVVLITTPTEGHIKLNLDWVGDNVAEIMSEIDSNDGNGFQFSGVTRLTYDNNVNPYDIITEHQFGFDEFFVANITTGLETLWFYNCFWQSQNNIKTREVFDSPSSTVPSFTEEFMYSYNEDYYPVSAVKHINSFGEMTTENLQWSY